jgi:hypothetical protein
LSREKNVNKRSRIAPAQTPTLPPPHPAARQLRSARAMAMFTRLAARMPIVKQNELSDCSHSDVRLRRHQQSHESLSP